jgi:hypothetical protein
MMTTMPLFAQSTYAVRLVVSILAVAMTGLGIVDTALASDETGARTFESSTSPIRRAEGLAYFDLPMQFRAAFDIAYTKDLYASDALARPSVTTAGPGIENDQSLESWFALTRALSNRVEIGIVWSARSPLGRIDLFDFERERVGAIIHIVP